MATTQSLNTVVDVSVTITPASAPTPTFNQGLIIGTSAHIPSAGNNSRARRYASLTEIATDGFATTDPEYIAASLYFGQTPKPTFVWIGRQDSTAIKTATVTASAQGTGYVVGDILSVVQVGASAGKVKVTTIGTSGAVTGVAVIEGSQGTGYATGTGLATTGGTGTGAEIDISAIGEMPAQAVQACRLAVADWYCVTVTGATEDDHQDVGAYIEAIAPQSAYFYTTQDVDTLTAMKSESFSRSFGLYSTTQSGLFPNNAYAAAAAMGRFMGLNTGLPGSYFTGKFKNLAGVAPEPITSTEVAAIENANGNVYLSYANSYTWLEQSVMANGKFFDEILNIDMLASDIQLSVVNRLVSMPSVPLNDSGQSLLISDVDGACERARIRGFIGPGNWKGTQILNLKTGDPMPTGYRSQSAPSSTRSTADTTARKAMPIYTAIQEAGAVHSLVVGVFVQQ